MLKSDLIDSFLYPFLPKMYYICQKRIFYINVQIGNMLGKNECDIIKINRHICIRKRILYPMLRIKSLKNKRKRFKSYLAKSGER